MASSEEWAYLAGLIDGEGSIMLIHHKKDADHKYEYWQPAVRVSNTDRRLIDWLLDKFGGSTIFHKNDHPNQKDAWSWSVRKAEIPQILEGCLKHLVIKREQAEIVLSYCSTHRLVGCKGHPPEVVEKRRQLAAELKRLNQRGKIAA